MGASVHVDPVLVLFTIGLGYVLFRYWLSSGSRD
jgi:hypothetical protein